MPPSSHKHEAAWVFCWRGSPTCDSVGFASMNPSYMCAAFHPSIAVLPMLYDSSYPSRSLSPSLLRRGCVHENKPTSSCPQEDGYEFRAHKKTTSVIALPHPKYNTTYFIIELSGVICALMGPSYYGAYNTA
jgi:hypothetical protein